MTVAEDVLTQVGGQNAKNSTVEDELSHHGVRGMKWGVRKSGGSSGGGGGSPKGETKKPSTDAAEVQKLRTKSAKELSNADLKKVNERVNMEQSFKKMNPSKIDKGHNQVKYLLTFVATGVAIHKALTSEAGKTAIAKGQKFLAGDIGKKAAADAAKKAATKAAEKHMAEMLAKGTAKKAVSFV